MTLTVRMNDSLELSPLPAGMTPHPGRDQENRFPAAAALASEADLLCDMGSPVSILSPMKLGKSVKTRPPALGNSTNARRESVPWFQNLLQWGSPRGRQQPAKLCQPQSPERQQCASVGMAASPISQGRKSFGDLAVIDKGIREEEDGPIETGLSSSVSENGSASEVSAATSSVDANSLGDAVAMLVGARNPTRARGNKRESVMWFYDLVQSSQQTLDNIDLGVLDEKAEHVRPANCLEESPSKCEVDPCAATPPPAPRPASPSVMPRVPSPAPPTANTNNDRLSGVSLRLSGRHPPSLLRPPSPSVAQQVCREFSHSQNFVQATALGTRTCRAVLDRVVSCSSQALGCSPRYRARTSFFLPLMKRAMKMFRTMASAESPQRSTGLLRAYRFDLQGSTGPFPCPYLSRIMVNHFLTSSSRCLDPKTRTHLVPDCTSGRDKRTRDENLKLIAHLLRDCLLSQAQFEAARQAILLHSSPSEAASPSKTLSPSRASSPARARSSVGATSRPSSPARGRTSASMESPARLASSRRSASPAPREETSASVAPVRRRSSSKPAVPRRSDSPVGRRRRTSAAAPAANGSASSSSSLASTVRPSLGAIPPSGLST